MEHLRDSASHSSSSSLAPFYTRAQRRRLARAMRWPLIVGGSVLLVVIVVLAAGWFW
jgi:tRNA A37 N6-isopentenylltransferase MiaA